MTTAQFITMVLDEVAASYTRQQVLDVVNDCQNQILGEDCGLMLVRPDPFLTTVAGSTSYSYVASTSFHNSTENTSGAVVGDIRTVREIYSYNNSVSIFDNQTLDPASEKPNQVEFTQTKDRVTMRFDCIDSIAPSAADCTVKIYATNDPGVTTTVWRGRVYLWPNQLTSENIALSIPADYQRTLLFYEVLKVLERREYGQNTFTYQEAEVYRKKFRRKYNSQATTDLRVAWPRVV